MYEILLERAAERDLRRIPGDEFQRIVNRIKGLAKDPRGRGCRKLSGSKRDWRLRVGDYRVIYEIDDEVRVVRVMRVRRRDTAYR